LPSLLEDLRDQRATARAAGDEILTRAAAEARDPSPDELAQYQAHVTAEREAADALEAERDRQLAEVRAMATRRTGPTLTRQAAETASAFARRSSPRTRPRSRSTPSSSPTTGPTTCPSRSMAGPVGSAFTPETP
jgi:hypothetical protein